MKQRITYLQIFFLVNILVGAALVFFAPSDYIGNEPKVLYWINLYAIVSGLGGMFFTLRLFAFKSVRQSVRNEDEQAGFSAFCRWTKVRLGILALALWSNVVLYQASSYTTTPKYCMLIILVAFVFCWPSRTEFEAIRKS